MYDIIGDVHGCHDELCALLEQLGYFWDNAGYFSHPERQAIFVGDLVDRGPKIVPVLRDVLAMCEHGAAQCLLGNHDDKLLRKLRGNNVQITHGLSLTLQELHDAPTAFSFQVRRFLEELPWRIYLDSGNVVVAHAGLPERLHVLNTPEARSFALYGDTKSERGTDGFAKYPHAWAEAYTGKPYVFHGHIVVEKAEWRGKVFDTDTGCVFGGALTALRYPEMEIVSVSAAREYFSR